MRPLSFKRRRFPADVIRQAVWRCFRFTLSFRDVEEMLAQRGIDVSYETIRCWTIRFGPQIDRNLKRRRPEHADSRAVLRAACENRRRPGWRMPDVRSRRSRR